MIQRKDQSGAIIISYCTCIADSMVQSQANTIFDSAFMGCRGMAAHRTQWFSICAQDLLMWHDL